MFFSPDLSASRSYDLSLKRLSEMPLSEGDILACWLKLRKGTCGRPSVLFTMEPLRGGGRLVVLVNTCADVAGMFGGGCGATEAGSFSSSNNLSFFLAFLSESWACLRHVAQR